jgi:hypothetical protein
MNDATPPLMILDWQRLGALIVDAAEQAATQVATQSNDAAQESEGR